MMISNSSINTVAFPSLATIQKTTAELLDRWQQWSDETFGGEYRDLVETVICDIILLVCCTAIYLYDYSKRCLGEAFGYWLTDMEQQFLAESGLWLEQLAFELLPITECFDESWCELAQLTVAARQILDYELSYVCAAM